MPTDCNWTRYCISILQPHDLSIYNIDPLALPLKDMKDAFLGKILYDINSMSSLKFLNKFKMHGGFLLLMDCIPIQKHRSAVNILRCGSFNSRCRSGAWSKEAKEIRTCRFCDLNCFEDEEHILSECAFFGPLRKALQDEVPNPILGENHHLDFCFSLTVFNICLCLPNLFTRCGK